ncbi:MAG: helix-turn-helix domain-containing protein [Loktanella sp.]|nr:helix-turn-helix domain-containing protein [Loktanella sp.]
MVTACTATPAPNASAAQPHPLTLRPQGLADRLGVSRRHLYKLLRHPDPAVRLPAPFKIGRATFWRAADINDWIERQANRNNAA